MPRYKRSVVRDRGNVLIEALKTHGLTKEEMERVSVSNELLRLIVLSAKSNSTTNPRLIELTLTKRARNVLGRVAKLHWNMPFDILRLSHIASMRVDDVEQFLQCGPKTLDEIHSLMAKYGFKFRNEP